MLTPFFTLTLEEEVAQSRNMLNSCVFHSVWPGDSGHLFLSGVGEQQWLQRTEQSIAACRCQTGLETHSFPTEVGVSLPYSRSSLFGSFFTPGGKWGHYDTLFPSKYPLETGFHGDQTQRDLSEEAVCQARCANTERGRWEGAHKLLRMSALQQNGLHVNTWERGFRVLESAGDRVFV